jgi:GTP diphosphokinase / guanosine-3',5'-bis(diphosphate) 3'-diphosphatase
LYQNSHLINLSTFSIYPNLLNDNISLSSCSTPSQEWINIVKTTQARNKIRSFFTKNEREVYIERGKYTLEKELRKRKLSFQEFFTDENIKKICSQIKVDNLEEIYLSVGNGRQSPNSVINIIDKIQEVPAPKVVKVAPKSIDADIIVNGIDKVKVNLANCCNPIHGDEIIGYITKGNGITVHRINCHNLALLDNRTIEVSWNSNTNKRYLANILVYSNTTDNHMLDIIQMISMMNINVDGIKTMNRTREVVYEISIYVTGVEQLDKLMLSFNKLGYIEKVERLIR